MIESSPAISVIVPAYGVAHLLHEALQSLQAQDFADWEAIVIDDGAPDDVAAAFAPFASDSRFRLIQTDNGGIAAARNRAIARARAPLIAFLDGDDLYQPDYLSTMTAAIAADPAIGFVTCDAVYFGTPAREGQPFSKYSAQSGPLTLDRVLSRKFNVFIGCVLRRVAFDQIGGFDTSLQSAEDLDLWIRLLETGWTGACVRRPLCRYRRRPGSLSWSKLSLLTSAEQVYRNAAARLTSRPEGATATRMLDAVRREISWIEGEELIRAGRAREGIAVLTGAGADRRSLRWRLAMPLMRIAPPLAPLLVQLRLWLPPLFPGAAE
jgi:glycosyltransferase involved in cell wall biosynthesis